MGGTDSATAERVGVTGDTSGAGAVAHPSMSTCRTTRPCAMSVSRRRPTPPCVPTDARRRQPGDTRPARPASRPPREPSPHWRRPGRCDLATRFMPRKRREPVRYARTQQRFGGSKTRPPGACVRSPNGIRTRVSTLRGWCPRPLDDGAPSGRTTIPAGLCCPDGVRGRAPRYASASPATSATRSRERRRVSMVGAASTTISSSAPACSVKPARYSPTCAGSPTAVYVIIRST